MTHELPHAIEADGPPAARRARPLLAWLRPGSAVQAACLGGALVHPVSSALSRYSWTADLLCHFREPGLTATILALVVTALARRFRVAAALAALAVWQTVPLTSTLGPNPVAPDPAAPPPLRVLMVNVLYHNFMYEDMANLIRRERPDVVGMVEYTVDWSIALADLHADYPYRVEVPAGVRGVALWFRQPPIAMDPPVSLVEDRNPILHARFEYAGRTRHIWVVHPRSPFWRVWKPGNPEVEAIARRVGSTAGSRIVVGDMNTTDGSAHFGDFLRLSGLRDSRLGFGWQRSWPTWLFYRIAIDHAFVSEDLAVVDRRLGSPVGSDHFPLIVALAPAASPATSSAHQPSGSTGPR
jgi:endonuclease/exonuclease/phosphatase (EEP) superfamily protein YafD